MSVTEVGPAQSASADAEPVAVAPKSASEEVLSASPAEGPLAATAAGGAGTGAPAAKTVSAEEVGPAQSASADAEPVAVASKSASEEVLSASPSDYKPHTAEARTAIQGNAQADDRIRPEV